MLPTHVGSITLDIFLWLQLYGVHVTTTQPTWWNPPCCNATRKRQEAPNLRRQLRRIRNSDTSGGGFSCFDHGFLKRQSETNHTKMPGIPNQLDCFDWANLALKGFKPQRTCTGFRVIVGQGDRLAFMAFIYNILSHTGVYRILGAAI